MIQFEQRPFVLLDSCFVLNKLNSDDYEGFLQQCQRLAEFRDARVIMPSGAYKEVERLLENRFEYNSYSHEGLKVLSEIEGKENNLDGDEIQLYVFLKGKAKVIGEKLKKNKSAKGLSYRDLSICAHSIILSRGGDVILATRDQLLADTSIYIYENVTKKVFTQRGYKESKIVTALDMSGLQERIQKFLMPQLS